MNLALHGLKLSVAITLVTIALSALFLAKGTTSLIAGMVLPPHAPARGASTAHAAHPPGWDLPDYQAILKRNIFDPTTGPLWPPRVAETDNTGTTETQPAPETLEQLGPGQLPPPCEGNAKLVAAVYSELHPDWSFATLTTGAETPLLYRVGARFEEKEIVAIMPRAVYMRQGNGKLCSLVLFIDKAALQAQASKTTPAIPPPATPPPSGSGSMSEAEMDQNIHAQGETKFSMSRAFVDRILANQAEIMSSARVVPHEENGRVVGVKLYGIRRNSLLGKLGLQNGDLLRTINGFEMSSPDTALEAYSRLRTASNLAVSVVRRGTPTNIQYDISQ